MKVDIAPEEVYILANLFSGGRFETPIEEIVDYAVDKALDSTLTATKKLHDDISEVSNPIHQIKYPKRSCSCSS